MGYTITRDAIRATVAEVLAEPSSAAAEPVRGAMAGSLVPHRIEGMAASVLAPDYQRIVSVLESEAGREGMRCQQLAVALGLQVVPAKVEGLRSKAKRLVERGWALQVRPGVFTALTLPAKSHATCAVPYRDSATCWS
ncbi:hypothetical protein ABZ835_45030 [Streptomyces sp. NPDC047461]|uniref:hypothetical protein n=1 Tax=Streptomyces sp. NPDC047461 TaxID=3155619 RepID=UPI0033E1077D